MNNIRPQNEFEKFFPQCLKQYYLEVAKEHEAAVVSPHHLSNQEIKDYQNKQKNKGKINKKLTDLVKF